MKDKPWLSVNIVLVAFNAYYAFESSVYHANIDIIQFVVVFFSMVLLPIGGMCYTVYGANINTVKRPSWNRNAFRVWFDPLQFIFIMKMISLSSLIGACFRNILSNRTYLSNIELYTAAFLGLTIGDRSVRRIFKK
jgi:hypothetical protein